jgi:hypothetical protein
MTRWMADNEFKNPGFVRLINFPGNTDILTKSIADAVILREAKRSRRIPK